MKKIIYIIALLALSGCSKDFLELYPKATLNEGNFYQSEVEYTLLANGCYVPMRENEKNNHWILAELISDNASFQNNVRTGEASRGIIDQFIFAGNNIAYSSYWNTSYNGITRCNKLISELDREGVKWSKLSLKDRCAGEALFLRALYYFNLVRQFGGVPLVLKPITSQEAVGIKRSTEAQVYESIVNDLKQAATFFANAKDVEENGRANEMSALALLGKVYLTTKKYAEAETALKTVVASGKYALLTEYADVFNPSKKDYKETIFAVQYSENSVELANTFIFTFAPHTSGGAVTLRPNVNIVGAGWNQPTDDLISAFETGDKRKNVSIAFWNGIDWDNIVRPIPYCAKYKAPIAAPDARCGDNFPILRYSDVLLMLAEAINEQGKTTEAIPFVQQVRTRAGLTNAISALSKDALSTLIAKERQVEFCFENQRWYDLKRTGKAVEVMAAHGIREKAKKTFLYPEAYGITANKLLAPIPVNEISINKLEQNPGY
ncbi:RagB/SusD family nutrient uptake outer membrane protein [Emticicia sp.]|uniref:RagB/SusD family nutrient uptake outer membrane protein n=1 Tax=Emticicia sp. TaxID=1930953 RepID=UPI003751A513